MSIEHRAQDITKGFRFAIPHQLQPGATGAADGAGFITAGQLVRDKMETTNMDVYNQYGQYQRYRQMSLDDMLLENRIVFLIGEIS